jgi:hypothetical protein
MTRSRLIRVWIPLGPCRRNGDFKANERRSLANLNLRWEYGYGNMVMAEALTEKRNWSISLVSEQQPPTAASKLKGLVASPPRDTENESRVSFRFNLNRWNCHQLDFRRSLIIVNRRSRNRGVGLYSGWLVRTSESS